MPGQGGSQMEFGNQEGEKEFGNEKKRKLHQVYNIALDACTPGAYLFAHECVSTTFAASPGDDRCARRIIG